MIHRQATLSARYKPEKTSRHFGQGNTAKDLAAALKVPLSTVYTELRRSRTGDRLPDQRLKYDAALAQLTMQQELERRGTQSCR